MIKHPVRVLIGLLSGAVVLVLAAVTLQTSGYERAFEESNSGDSEALVLDRFGDPTIRELQGHPFLRYATSGCQSPCAQRLWWEHPILRGIEAWSVEFDSHGRLVHKAHWVSP